MASQDFRVSKADLNEFLQRLGVRPGRARDRAIKAIMSWIVHFLMEELWLEYARRSEGYSGTYMSPWRPLMPSTVARKRREGYPKPDAINVRSSRLLNAFEPGKVSNNRYYSKGDQKVTINDNSATISIDVEYFEAVQAKRPIWNRTAFKAMAAKAVKKGLRAYLDTVR